MPSNPMKALERALAGRPDRLGALARGATAKAIASFEAKLELRLPASFYALHRFRDGQEALPDVPFAFSMELLSLAGVLVTKKGLDECEATNVFADWKPGEWWNPGWVPFMTDRSSVHVVIDTVGSFGGRKGQVLAVRLDAPTRTRVAASFDEWLGIAASALTKELEPDDEDKLLLGAKNKSRKVFRAKRASKRKTA